MLNLKNGGGIYMTHKEKCKQMKKIRKQIADSIGVELHQTECTYQGNCKGTCPKCESEEKKLNKAILSSKVALAGLALSSISLTGCGSDKDDNTSQTPTTLTEEISPLAGEETCEPTTEEILDGDIAIDTQEPEIMGDTVEIEGLEEPAPEELTGNVTVYYTNDMILEACQTYSNAPSVRIDSYDGYNVIVQCYEEVSEGHGLSHTTTSNWITVNTETGEAVDMSGNTFIIDDYIHN